MKSFSWIKTSLCVLATIALLSACGGGGSSPITPEATTTSLKIVVQNEAGSPVSAARVRVAGTDMTTDASGAVSTTLPNSDTETVALITKAGFATNAKTAIVYSGKASELQVTLFTHQVVSTFAANAGVTVMPGSATVQIPAAAGFRTSAGAAYTGSVTISSSYFNPETVRGIQGFAAPYVGTDAGAPSSLVSLGVIEVKFTAADGAALEMTNAAAATLTYPATSNSSGQATVPLWYYDEAAKIWVRDGQATRQADGSYVGTVTHFTLWNLDLQFVDGGTLNVCFRDAQNQPVSPVFANISGIGWSRASPVGANGSFEIIRIPTGQPLELRGTNPVFAPISIAPLAPNEVRNLPCVVLAGPATNFTQRPVTTVPVVTPTTPTVTPTTPVVTPTTPVVTPTTPTVTPTTPIVTPTTPVVTPTTPTVTPTTPVVTPTTPSTTASFAGTYTGTYTGVEVGTFNVVVSSAGVVSGNVFSQTFPGQVFPVSGQVGSNGQVSLTATGQAGSSNFVGTISAGGVVSGTWSYNSPLTGGGTFSGQRQMSSANQALLAQYVGTWRSSCAALSQGSTDELATIAAATSTGSADTSVIRFYSSSNCSGNPVATVTRIPGSLVANGTKIVGAQTVVRVDSTSAAGAPTLTGSASLGPTTIAGERGVNVSINGLTFEIFGAYSLNVQTEKDILSQPGAGNTFTAGLLDLTTGGPAPVDSLGYPQSLDPSNTYTRQ